MKYIFGCLFFFLVSCLNKIDDVKSVYKENTMSDFGLEIEINYYGGGDLEFTLTAPQIETINSPVEKKLFPKGIQVYAYNKDLDTIATISANFAIENQSEELFEARQNVILKNFKNEQLNTEKLFWNRETKKIYTNDFVTLTTEQQIIMGFGFNSDQYFSTYTLSNITGTIYL
tara:strand:- start:165 stop:683 length:519 start_codon:yes stop_codon:yes gene_type:complete